MGEKWTSEYLAKCLKGSNGQDDDDDDDDDDGKSSGYRFKINKHLATGFLCVLFQI